MAATAGVDQLDPPPVGRFMAALRKISHRQITISPAMRPKIFGHPLAVPWIAPAAKHAPHIAVRPLMQEKMPAVIIATLVVQPELTFDLVSVFERRQPFRQQNL